MDEPAPMESVLRFFSSVKLAIVLLIIITLASILGTLIPQHRNPNEYMARYGQLADLMQKLQMTKLYQSLWFIGLLFILSMNITVCTLNRLFPKLKKAFQPRLEFHEKEITTLKINEKLLKNMPLNIAKEKMKQDLSSRHYLLKVTEARDRVFFLARKKFFGLFGSDVVHLGILIILAGGIISGIGGFRNNLTFIEGQDLSVPKADFRLRLDKFETEYYPNGSVKDWKSTLTVLENDKPVQTKVVEVNHPLSYKGFVFYQNSFGWNWRNPSLKILVKKKNNPSFIKEIEMKTGEKVSLGDEKMQIIALHFIPDFVINEKSEITSRSLKPNNPAVFIEGWQEKEKVFSGWIFAKFPDFSRIHFFKKTDLSFVFKDFKASPFSVIQAAKDPGVNLIWLGWALVMIGLALAFYWPSREIKLIFQEINNQTEIIAGGLATKNQESFSSEFREIMTSIRRAK